MFGKLWKKKIIFLFYCILGLTIITEKIKDKIVNIFIVIMFLKLLFEYLKC